MFDKINPGGRYAARVKQLGSYAAPGRATPLKPAPSDADPSINDPLWGNLGSDGDVAALWRLLRLLRLACKGLLTHLLQLNSRWGQHVAVAANDTTPCHCPANTSVRTSCSLNAAEWR